MPPSPSVTIVVAAYNSQRSIDRCLTALLSQDYPDFDILVVDNNSTDRTAEKIKKHPVRYLFESRKGWPAARNAGAAAATADFIANIDADCFARPDWLARLMDGFDRPAVGAVVGKTRVEPGRTAAQRYYAGSDPFNIEKMIGRTRFVPWGGGNNAMRKEAFLKAGGYDDRRFVSGADVEFHYRLWQTHGYETVYRPRALIYHEARGSAREFFTVASKYAHDGFLRSRTPEMQGSRHKYDNRFLPRYLGFLARDCGAVGYRLAMMAAGRGARDRLAASFFSAFANSGVIFGYCRGLGKHLKGEKVRLP